MRKIHKIVTFLIVCVLSLSLFSCAGTTEKPNEPEVPTPPPPVEKVMTISEYTQELNKSEYASDALSGKYGLSDGNNVGVKHADTQLVKYQKADDFLFETANIIDFEQQVGANDTAKLNEVMQKANALKAANKKIKIKFPNRAINIVCDQVTTSSAAYTLVFDGFSGGLYLEGGDNTEFILEITSSWKGGLSLSNSKDVHLNGIRVDYKYAPVLTGKVLSTDDETNKIVMEIPQSMHEQVDFMLKNNNLYKTVYSLIQYNSSTKAPAANGVYMIHSEGYIQSVVLAGKDAADNETPYTLTFTFKNNFDAAFKMPRIGSPFTIGYTMYGNAGMTFSQIENLYVEDCVVYTCPGMAFTVGGCTNVFVNRMNFQLKGDRLMTATADGFHINSCLGKVSITNCILENTHDDALNIKSGYYYNLSNYDSIARQFIITKKTGGIDTPKIGDKIEIYKQDDLTKMGTFTVKEVTGTAAAFTITVEERISGSLDWNGCVVTNVSHSATLEFANNIVRNKRNRGILVQVRQALIENNTFMNVAHGSISVHTSLDIFNEATMPKDAVIRNNKLINNGYYLSLRGDISIFAIADGGKVAPGGTLQGMEIYNNYITDSGNTGISLRGVGGNSNFIKNNLFYNTARVYASEMTEGCIELENVNDITIEGNYNYYTLGSETHSGIIPAGLTKPETITLKDNINLKYQMVEGEAVKINVSKLSSGAITVDGNLSDWADKGTMVAMDGASIATGDEITRDVYQDVFDVRTAKIAWDDNGIYFAYEVYDNKPDYKTQVNFWNGDCVEIFMSDFIGSPNADFQLYCNEYDVMQIAMVPSWSTPFTFGTNRTNQKFVEGANSFRVKMTTVENGYAGELFVPFSVGSGFKDKIDKGEPIAIAMIFADNDRDEISRKRLQVGNVPHFVEAYKTKTAKMQQFIFIA